MQYTYTYKNGKLYSFRRRNGITEIGYVRKSCTTPYLRGEEYYSGKRKVFYVHRRIWEIHYGPIPKDMKIDHKNGNSLDNRIENLRCVTQRENIRNSNLVGKWVRRPRKVH